MVRFVTTTVARNATMPNIIVTRFTSTRLSGSSSVGNASFLIRLPFSVMTFVARLMPSANPVQTTMPTNM